MSFETLDIAQIKAMCPLLYDEGAGQLSCRENALAS